VEGQADDGCAAIAANFLARCCSPRRAASRHGWLLGGTHFRCTRGGFGWVAGFSEGLLSISMGRRGAGISCHRSARPRYSIAMFPCRPSHTSTLSCAGAPGRLCASCNHRFWYRTTPSLLIVRSFSNRKIRSSSAPRSARRW